MARCIAIDHGVRCQRHAGKRSGDIFVCRQHSTMWTMLLLDDALSTSTRKMLTFARWETATEGQRLIDKMHTEAA